MRIWVRIWSIAISGWICLRVQWIQIGHDQNSFHKNGIRFERNNFVLNKRECQGKFEGCRSKMILSCLSKIEMSAFQ